MNRMFFSRTFKHLLPCLLSSLLWLYLVPAAAQSSDPAGEPTVPSNALRHYLDNGDTTFHWEVKESYPVSEVTMYNILLTSQNWRGIHWVHQLAIFVPKEIRYDGALLFITGGAVKDGQPNWAGRDDKLLNSIHTIASRNKAIVAVLKQTPNQPLFGELKEDELISYTLHKFKEDGDYTWPLLFPMVKSACRAMDAVQQFADGQLHHPVRRFVVSGASKRGWTTWLTGASDPRAEAIGPMVIDILNMPVNLDYQIKAWHEYSPQIEDYVKLGIPQEAHTESGSAINAMVDPYSYRKLLTMPKMIFMGTNDEYWVVDAIKNYYDSIPGRNMIHYVPNAGHDLGGGAQAFTALSAFFGQTLRHEPYPVCSWSTQEKKGEVTVTVGTTARLLTEAILWTADSKDMIFRKSVWKSEPLGGTGRSKIVFTKKFPDSGFRAFYLDLKYKDTNGGEYTESTRMFVADKNELKLSASGASVQSSLSPLPAARNGFVVISHRGNHVKVPENTIASIQEAIRVGADYVELDLRTTKDGYLVLSHDATVDRMTDGKGKVRDLTFEEIGRLKVGKDSAMYRIPTFRDVLKVCKGRVNIYLDFKDADVEETYRQIKAAGMERQVVVYLNKVEQYAQWKKTAPDMPLMGSLPDQVKTPEQFRQFLTQVQLKVLDNVYDTALQAVAYEKGIALWLDVESAGEGPALWDKALAWNIQGLQTDHPEELVEYLQKTRRRNGRGVSNAGHGAESRAVLPSYRKLSDIAYGPDRENIMDAYFPSEYTDGKVIVYIHGGGWTGGDKGELPAALVEELTGRRKYILVSMNYRLVKDGRNIFPAQMEDVDRALKFISDRAKKYHYDGNAFALMGGSAGGHLAMLYAYGYDTARRVKAVVDLWGPTDLSDKAVRAGNRDADSKVVNLLGVADPQAQVCLDASPYYRVSKISGVPTILFHGEDDPLVDVSQAKKMYQKLLSLGVPAELKVYPHEKHGVGAGAAGDVFARTLAWLDQYFPPAPKDTRTYAERLGWPKGAKVIILHVDDAGMSINSNEGAINSIEKGVATSTSIMMPCPWAASFAKYAAEKGYDAGLHLTLTSEWDHYRWGPLAGVKQVPGLTDKEWCLWPEVEDVVKHASADEVELEIRAQLARALSLGLHPTHLDSHMGTLFANRAYLERYIKMGIENKIPVMFPGGNDKLLIANMKEGTDLLKDAPAVGEMIWKAGLPVLDDLVTYSGDWKPQPVDGKISPEAYGKYKVRMLEEAIDSMEPGVAMFIVHSSVVTDDFRHISASGDSRNADMLAMMDPELKDWIKRKGIILTTWREMMQRRGQVQQP